MVHTEETADRYRWVILGVLWVTYIVVFLNRLSVGPLAPFFKDDLGITSTKVGLVMSAAAFGYMLSMFPIGWVVDRIGGRLPMVAGELIAGACMLGLFLVTSYTGLLMLMFVTGLGCGFLLPATSQGVIVWFPLRERATVMGLKQTAVNIGGIITAATLPTVALALGWRYGFLFLGILAIAIGAIAFILYKDPPISATGSAGSAAADDDAVPLLAILKSREIWLLALCGFCMTWVEMALIAHLVLYLTEVLLFGVVAAGGLLAMTEVAGAVARPGGGLLSDRVFGGNRKKVFALIAGTTSIMCLIVGLFAPHLSWSLYPVLLILGMGSISFGGVWLTLLSEFGGRRGAGKAVGLGGMITLAGAAVGPPVFGYIVDTTGSYTGAWISLACGGAVCLLLLVFVRESKRRI
jgi:ACS family hexuronate transporter-like MFS transporter